jgi:hypothetical protein
MKMLLASAYDQSKYWRTEDLRQPTKLKIERCSEELVGQGADQEQKLVVWFTNSPKGLPLNRTNNRTLRAAFGDDTAGWKGKVIELFPTKADFRGSQVGAMRVRIPAPKETTTATKPAATTKPAPEIFAPEPDVNLDDEILF